MGNITPCTILLTTLLVFGDSNFVKGEISCKRKCQNISGDYECKC